jgi:hypothetical protein
MNLYFSMYLQEGDLLWRIDKTVLWGLLGPSAAFWGLLWPSGAFWGLLGPSIIESYLAGDLGVIGNMGDMASVGDLTLADLSE